MKTVTRGLLWATAENGLTQSLLVCSVLWLGSCKFHSNCQCKAIACQKDCLSFSFCRHESSHATVPVQERRCEDGVM